MGQTAFWWHYFNLNFLRFLVRDHKIKFYDTEESATMWGPDRIRSERNEYFHPPWRWAKNPPPWVVSCGRIRFYRCRLPIHVLIGGVSVGTVGIAFADEHIRPEDNTRLACCWPQSECRRRVWWGSFANESRNMAAAWERALQCISQVSAGVAQCITFLAFSQKLLWGWRKVWLERGELFGVKIFGWNSINGDLGVQDKDNVFLLGLLMRSLGWDSFSMLLLEWVSGCLERKRICFRQIEQIIKIYVDRLLTSIDEWNASMSEIKYAVFFCFSRHD